MSAGAVKNSIAHILWRTCFEHEVGGRSRHIAHTDFSFVMGCSRHVGNDEVCPSIVIQISSVSAHTKHRGIGYGLFDYISECTVTIVMVKIVSVAPVVSHIKVRVAVIVVIPPCSRESTACFRDNACFLSHICEGSITIVLI